MTVETIEVETLNLRLRRAATYLEGQGWSRRKERDETTGAVDIIGALRFCAPLSGDFYLIRDVFRFRGYGELWNDRPERTDKEVLEYLRTATIEPAELVRLYGPQWPRVRATVRQAASLLPWQVTALSSEWHSGCESAGKWSRAWDATIEESHIGKWEPDRLNQFTRANQLVGDAVKDAEWNSLQRRVREGTKDATAEAWQAAHTAARYIGSVASVVDLLPADRFAVLFKPWFAAFGTVPKSA